MTDVDKLLAEIFAPAKKKMPVITDDHPFLNSVGRFMEDRDMWKGSISDLLFSVGDRTTPPTTASKLLHKYADLMYIKYGLEISFKRYNSIRLIEIVTVE